MKPKGVAYKKAQWSLKKYIEMEEKGSLPLSLTHGESIIITHASLKSAWFTIQIPSTKHNFSIPIPYYDYWYKTQNKKKLIIFRDGHQYVKKEDLDIYSKGILLKEIYESNTSINKKFLIIDSRTGKEVYSPD